MYQCIKFWKTTSDNYYCQCALFWRERERLNKNSDRNLNSEAAAVNTNLNNLFTRISFSVLSVHDIISWEIVSVIEIFVVFSIWNLFTFLLLSDFFFALACFFLRLIIRKILFELEKMLKWSIDEISNLSEKK